MFREMVVERIHRIPKSCISKRWTMGVRNNNGRIAFVAPEQMTQISKYGTLKSSCNNMWYYTSYMDDEFNELQQMFDKHSVDLKENGLIEDTGETDL